MWQSVTVVPLSVGIVPLGVGIALDRLDLVDHRHLGHHLDLALRMDRLGLVGHRLLGLLVDRVGLVVLGHLVLLALLG